jgi:G3E family GTPase
MDEFFDILHESPLDNWFEVGSIIGIIDPESDDRMTEQMEYLFASEASCCGKLVVSKYNADVDVKKMIEHLNSALEEIKCDRRFAVKDVIAKDWNELNNDDFSAIMNSGYRSSRYVKKFRADEILSSVRYFMHISIPDDRIVTVISDIMRDEKCGRIFRIKG